MRRNMARAQMRICASLFVLLSIMMIFQVIFMLSVFHVSSSEYENTVADATTARPDAVVGDREGWLGYVYYNEVNSYLKLHTDPEDWNTARMNCHDEDAVLAAPINNEMVNILRRFLYDMSPAIHVAVQIKYPELVYTYKDGKPVLIKNPDVNKLDYCGVYDKNYSTTSWVSCQERLPYVCQAPAQSPCVGQGYELDSRTGKCYKFHTQSLPWNEAHRACLDDGAHLAIANSQTEANVLVDIFQKYPFEALNNTHPLWGVMAVGFYYWKEADQYVTIFGETLEEAGYAQWSYGNPSSRGKSKELGGGMFRSGLLDDVNKSYKVPYICEKKPIQLNIGYPNSDM